MIMRTPPVKKQRGEATVANSLSVGSDQPLVIYEDPPTPTPESSNHMLCTYQCRQMVKSEFLEALSSAEKQVCDYQKRLEALNDIHSNDEAEKKKIRDHFLHAEQELAAAEGREHALQEQLLKEVNESQERLRKHIQSYSELEVKLHNEIALRQKAESLVAIAEEKANLLDEKLSHASETNEREKRRLNNELVQLSRESELSVHRISTNLEKMEARASNAEKESELFKAQMEDLKKKFIECLNQKSEVEKKFLCYTSQEVASPGTNILVKHLQDEIRHYDSELRDARKLKSFNENIELLKEKLAEEKGRRERSESELSKLQEVQLNMKTLEDELSSWKLMIKEIPGVSCSDDIPVKFASLQKEVIDSMIKVGEMNSHLKQMEVNLDALQFAKQNAETDTALAKEKEVLSESEVKRIEMMLSVVTEERDKLRNIVKEIEKPKSDGARDDKSNENITKEFASCIAKKEHCINELGIDLLEQKEISNRQHNEIKLLTERLNNEVRRTKSLERECDRLRSEISLLESKLGHGEFSAASTRVLRMVNTLGVDNEAKQTIEALKAELQKTKDKLQAVEELNNQSGDAGKLVDCHISGKIMQFKEQIATLEKREERYKTVFADRISVFRRACCELFGYKIVMDEHQRSNGIPVTRFILQSIFAQNSDEKLEFEYESGNTNILANDYSSQREISQQVEIFIRKFNSIPAFTANLTMESFNKRTIS